MQSKYVFSFALAITFVAAPFARAGSLHPAVTTGSAVRSFVSSTGLDSNPCTRTAPCRSFGAAIAQTISGGTVAALDSAGYGSLVLSSSITLVAPDGIYAALTATSGTVVAIQGAAATDVINLRGLSIEGGGTASNGVFLSFDHLKTLRVQNCAFRGFINEGIYFIPSNTGAALYVSNTTLDDSGTAIQTFANPGLLPNIAIDHTDVTGGSSGFWIEQSNALITNSHISGATSFGILGQSGTTQLTVDHCTVTGTLIGVSSGAFAVVRLSNSVVVNNATGLDVYNNGALLSVIGDATYTVHTNLLANNTTPGAFTGTVVQQ